MSCTAVSCSYVFYFNDTATTEIYTYCHTLSLHVALPILIGGRQPDDQQVGAIPLAHPARLAQRRSGCEHCTVGLGRRAAGAEIAALAREAPGSDAAALAARSDERRVGKACGSTCRSRW